MRKRGREAWAKWRGGVAEQQRSGQSVAAFCRERNVCAASFFAWKKRLWVYVGDESNPYTRNRVESVHHLELAHQLASWRVP